VGAVMVVTLGLAVSGCAAADQASPRPAEPTQTSAASASANASAAAAGPDIARIDLCVWVNTSLAAMNATFGSVSLVSAARDQVLRRGGHEEAVSCDIRSSGTDSTGHDQTIGTVTLISGGEPVAGAAQRGVSQSFASGSYAGMSAVENYPAASLAAVQLEKGLVLNVEGLRAADNQDMDMLFTSGVKPLIEEMLKQRDQHQVYDVQENSHADAEAFCDSLALSSMSDLGLPSADATITTASGVQNWDGTDLGGGGPVFSGTRTCGVETYAASTTDLWSWNSPFGSKKGAASFTFYSYPDAASAADAFKVMQFGSALPHAAMGAWIAIADKNGGSSSGMSSANAESAMASMTKAVESAGPPALGGGD